MLRVGNMPQEKRPLHALNRLGYGPCPGDLERVNQVGVERYIREQLDPESIPVPPDLTRRVDALETLHMNPVELFAAYQLPVQRAKGDKDAQKEARQRAQVILQEAVAGRLMRAIYGPRQLQEVMTAFWFNHFNVFAGKGLCRLWIGAYEQEAIRPHTKLFFDVHLMCSKPEILLEPFAAAGANQMIIHVELGDHDQQLKQCKRAAAPPRRRIAPNGIPPVHPVFKLQFISSEALLIFITVKPRGCQNFPAGMEQACDSRRPFNTVMR